MMTEIAGVQCYAAYGSTCEWLLLLVLLLPWLLFRDQVTWE